MGYPRDHARKETAVGLCLLAITLDGAEAQGIHEENGTGPHGENIPDDATDTGGRTLKRLDRAGMIMALYLEGHGPSVADIDDPGILLSSLDQDTRAGGWKLTQLGTGIFVGAMFAPHHGEDPQFLKARLAAQNGENFFIFLRRETVLGDEFGSDGLIGHGRNRLNAGGGNGVDHGLKDAAPISASEDRITDTLGMGHQPKDIPPMAADSRDIFQRAVGIGRIGETSVSFAIAQEHLIVRIQRPQYLRIGKVAALAMGNRYVKHLALMEHGGKGRVVVFHTQGNMLAAEEQSAITHQRAGQ